MQTQVDFMRLSHVSTLCPKIAPMVVTVETVCVALGRDMLWSPTIRAALLAGTPWLDVFCPGCGTSRPIDLRTLDRHPLTSVGTLVLGLRCSWCPGSDRPAR